MSAGNGTTAITKTTSDPLAAMGFAPKDLPQAIAMAEMLGKSGLVPRAIAGKPSDILVVLLTGHEFGLSPMASLRLISVIEGKPVVGGECYLAVAQASPECEFFRCTNTTDKVATFEAKRRGDDKTHTLSWTIEQAGKAGLLNKDNWRKYPAEMLRWRCVSALAKLVFASRFSGVYIPDEEEEIGATAANTVESTAVDARPTTDKLAEKLKETAKPKTATVEVVSSKPVEPKPEEPKGEAPKTIVGYAELKADLARYEILYDVGRLETDKDYAATKQGEVNLAREVRARTAKAADNVTSGEGRAVDASAAPVPDEAKMIFGPLKDRAISSLSGPELLEQISFGSAKLGDLKEQRKIDKVKWNIAALQFEMKKREAAMLGEAPQREPGDDID